MKHNISELDQIIHEEKRQIAIEYHHQAWAEGVANGIEAEILAMTAFSTALQELLQHKGEDDILSLLDELREKLVAGAFLKEKILQ